MVYNLRINCISTSKQYATWSKSEYHTIWENPDNETNYHDTVLTLIVQLEFIKEGYFHNKPLS